MLLSGGFRNSERGVQSLAREVRPQILGLPRPLPVTLEVRIYSEVLFKAPILLVNFIIHDYMGICAVALTTP